MQLWVVNKNNETFRWDMLQRSCACCYGLCTVAFFKWSLQARWTSTLKLAMTMRFSPHNEETKLTLVLINRRWRNCSINFLIKERWHLLVSSVGKKQSQEVFPFPQFSIFWLLVPTVACMGVIFSLNWNMFLSLITSTLRGRIQDIF